MPITMAMLVRVSVAARISKGCSAIDGLEFHGQQGLAAQAVQQGGAVDLDSGNPADGSHVLPGLAG